MRVLGIETGQGLTAARLRDAYQSVRAGVASRQARRASEAGSRSQIQGGADGVQCPEKPLIRHDWRRHCCLYIIQYHSQLLCPEHDCRSTVLVTGHGMCTQL